MVIPKTVVIGATGFLGSQFLSAYRRIYPDCAGTARRSQCENVFALDLLDPNIAPLRLAEKGYKEALILAGITRISECERNKEMSRKVNVDGTLELIHQLASEGIKPVFASSDYVFDGVRGGYSETSPVNPTTEYGRQKAEVESQIGSISSGNYLVIRLSKVFSLEKGDATLLDEIAAILSSGKTAHVAYDQVFSPTLISDLIDAVLSLQKCGATGLINVCSPEVWARYDLAIEIAGALGVEHKKRVWRISLNELEFGPIRPKNTSMQIKRLRSEVNPKFTPISECIEKVRDNWKKDTYERGYSIRERSLAEG